MNSEIMVVLVLTAIAAGLLVWVRMKSQPESHNEQPDNRSQNGESDGR